MLQEHENELESQNKDLYPIVDTNYNSQKISKYIDTDPYSYISELIIQISKNITNGRGLSQAGVNSLFLFLLTGGLLYEHTIFPQTTIGFFKLYIVPLLFLLYFFIDILKNIPRINTIFMITFRRNDFVYSNIISDSINLYVLDYYLRNLPFNSEQVINIVKNLIRNKQFSPSSQTSLMHNRSLYGIKSINYIKNLLLDFNFTSSSVCIFLYHMQNSLDYEYLDKIIDKYGCFPSVLFCVGHFHKYKKDDSNP
jgi:hypothetical protein